MALTLDRTTLRNVLVKKGRGALCVSSPTPLGWKCGRCLRGNLGIIPKLRQKCRVCKAVVREIQYGAQQSLDRQIAGWARW